MSSGSCVKTSGYIITGVVDNVSAAVDDVDVVVVILSGVIVGDNDDSPALSLDRASLDVGDGNDKFTFLINSRLSELLFITTESTTALCPGSGLSELGLFGDVVVLCLINSEGGSSVVVKIGNVPP